LLDVVLRSNEVEGAIVLAYGGGELHLVVTEKGLARLAEVAGEALKQIKGDGSRES
jgi:hypothetical protein